MDLATDFSLPPSPLRVSEGLTFHSFLYCVGFSSSSYQYRTENIKHLNFAGFTYRRDTPVKASQGHPNSSHVKRLSILHSVYYLHSVPVTYYTNGLLFLY